MERWYYFWLAITHWSSDSFLKTDYDFDISCNSYQTVRCVDLVFMTTFFTYPLTFLGRYQEKNIFYMKGNNRYHLKISITYGIHSYRLTPIGNPVEKTP